MPYAKYTSVPINQTRNEIEKELRRFSASEFGYLTRELKEGTEATIAFRINKSAVRISIDVPENEQQARARWRALFLVIKSKLVACEEGISTVEREFLADVVAPNGRTVFENIKPALEGGRTPALFPPME